MPRFRVPHNAAKDNKSRQNPGQTRPLPAVDIKDEKPQVRVPNAQARDQLYVHSFKGKGKPDKAIVPSPDRVFLGNKARFSRGTGQV